MIKRSMDIVCSALGLLMLLPLFILVGILVKLDSEGPVFFRQVRVGRHGKIFRICKFRTMKAGTESSGHRITKEGDVRITGIGRWLRRYKIDELPQLFNVLRGDMSLVGPRPEVPEYVKLFNNAQRHVLDVRPGLTDYASIKFRNEEEVLREADNIEEAYVKEILPQKLALNLEYIRERNILLDVELIFLTLYKIFKK